MGAPAPVISTMGVAATIDVGLPVAAPVRTVFLKFNVFATKTFPLKDASAPTIKLAFKLISALVILNNLLFKNKLPLMLIFPNTSSA